MLHGVTCSLPKGRYKQDNYVQCCKGSHNGVVALPVGAQQAPLFEAMHMYASNFRYLLSNLHNPVTGNRDCCSLVMVGAENVPAP